jgi:hypothetical protein
MDWLCSDLRAMGQHSGDELGELNGMLRVLRSTEVERLYIRLGEELQVPRTLASAQAAVIRQAGACRAASFVTSGPPLHHTWSSDSDRAGLLGLIAAGAWWMREHSEDSDIDDVIHAIFDVTSWWS